MTADELSAPGWWAIDQALTRLYPGQLPHQYTSPSAYEPTSSSPLPAVAVYEVPRAKIAGVWHPAHWHYIGYGLSELFEKLSDDPDVSGAGYELTLRVPRAEGDDRPPAWGVRLIQALGRYVMQSGDAFDTGYRADLGGPLVPGVATALCGIACVPDPALGKITTPFGSLLFLQVVGLHADELAAVESIDYERLVLMLAEIDHYALTDLSRETWLKGPKAATVRRYRLGIGL